MDGSNGSIFAIGDCTASSYAPTAQVASQQGAYLARTLMQIAKRDSLEARLAELERGEETMKLRQQDAEGAADRMKALEGEIQAAKKKLAKIKLRPFHYSHQGSLACVFLHPKKKKSEHNR
jgi:NADH:ubiquinone reductase (non-electrogenic)